MINIGFSTKEKIKVINNYCNIYSIKKVYYFFYSKFDMNLFNINHEKIEWNNIIRYVYFYRLIQEIEQDSLIVIDECLRSSNRYELTYNCLRHFLNQTDHCLIFQYIPIINNINDFFILFDFDTKSKYKIYNNYNDFKHASIKLNKIKLKINELSIETDNVLKQKYEKRKRELFNNLKLKDPHTIPRNLYLISGRQKLRYVDASSFYIGRNNRFKINNFNVFKDKNFLCNNYTIFEICHSKLNFIDFLYLTKQTHINMFVCDLKVDKWYYKQYQDWIKDLKNAYSIIQQNS